MADYYEQRVGVQPTFASPVQHLPQRNALTELGSLLGVLGDTGRAVSQLVRTEEIERKQAKEADDETALADFRENSSRLELLAQETKDPAALQQYLTDSLKHPNQKIRTLASEAQTQLLQKIEQGQAQQVTADRQEADRIRIQNDRIKAEAEATAKSAGNNVEKLLVGDRTIGRTQPLPEDTFLQPNKLHAHFYAGISDEILKIGQATGVSIPVDSAGLIKDPVLRAAIERQAFELTAKQLESDARLSKDQQTKRVNSDLMAIGFSSTKDDISQLKKGMEVIQSLSPVGTEAESLNTLVQSRTASVVSSVNTAERSPQDALKSLAAMRDYLRGIPQIGNRFDEVLLKATDTVLDRFKDVILAESRKVSGSKIGQHSTALMERLPSGQYRIDAILTEQASAMGIPAIGDNPQSIYDFDLTTADPIQRMLLNKMEEVRSDVQNAAVRETNWTPNRKPENELQRAWQVGAGVSLSPSEQSSAWSLVSTVEALGRKNISPDAVSQLVAKAGMPLESVDSVMEAINNGNVPEHIIIAAGKVDAESMVKNRSVPPKAASNLTAMLASPSPNDVLAAQSTIAGLGGPGSQLFLNSLQGGDEDKAETLANALALGSLFSTTQSTPIDLNWYATYDAMRQSVKKADITKDSGSQIFNKLYGGSVGKPREERMFKAMRSAELIPENVEYSQVAMFVDPAIYGAVEELAAGMVLKYPNAEPSVAWQAAMGVVRSNGIQFVRDGNTITTVYDPHQHYEQPSVAEGRIRKEITRVIPSMSNEQVQLKEFFGIDPSENTNGWTTWEYIRRGVPELAAYGLGEYQISVEYSGFGGSAYLQKNNPYIPGKNTPDLSNTWLAGGGVVTLSLRDGDNQVKIPIVGKNGEPFTWSVHRQNILGVHKDVAQFRNPDPVTKASPESEKIREMMNNPSSPWPSGGMIWGPKPKK